MSTTYNGLQSGAINVPKKRTTKKEKNEKTDEEIMYLISRIIALDYLLNRIEGIKDELQEIEEIALSLYKELNK
jgi:Mg2+ and Co2+ transporter CorA